MASSPGALFSKSLSFITQQPVTAIYMNSFAYFGEMINPLSRPVKSESLYFPHNDTHFDCRDLVAGRGQGLGDVEGRGDAWHVQRLPCHLESQLSGTPLRNLCHAITEYHLGSPCKGSYADLYRCFKQGSKLVEELVTKGGGNRLLDVSPVSVRLECDVVFHH